MAKLFPGGLTRLKGKAGDYYYRRSLDGKTIMSAMPRQTERKSSLVQMERRIIWGNLINAWRSMGKNESFENRASNQSDYNRFMQINLGFPTDPSGEIYLPWLTKGHVEQGFIVPFPYVLSQGSLSNPSIMGNDTDENVIIYNTSSETGAGAKLKETLLNAGYEEGQRLTFVMISDFNSFDHRFAPEIYSFLVNELSGSTLPPFMTYVAGTEETDLGHFKLEMKKRGFFTSGIGYAVCMINGDVVDGANRVGNGVWWTSVGGNDFSDFKNFSAWTLIEADGYRKSAIDSYGGTSVRPFLQVGTED